MKLTRIDGEVCPICGSYAVSETKTNQHCNGYWNESRTFKCGSKIEFSPNFMRTEMNKYYQCPHQPEVVKKKKLRNAALDRIVNYINKYIKVDETYKKDLIHTITFKSNMIR